MRVRRLRMASGDAPCLTTLVASSALPLATASPELAEILGCPIFFKHEDDGTAPKFACRLMEVMSAPAAPAGGSEA